MRRPPATSYFEPAKVVTLEIDVSPDEIPQIDVPPKKAAPAGPEGVAAGRPRGFREILRDHLVFRGFRVTSVPSGVEGLREIQKGAFNLIICDMMMPQSGGESFYWAVTRLRPDTA